MGKQLSRSVEKADRLEQLGYTGRGRRSSDGAAAIYGSVYMGVSAE